MNFWQKLKKPIFVLAPMANVTDAVFRSIIARNGKPDVMWTEFVSVDGLLSPAKEKLLVDLKYSGSERPIVAQIFGSDPDKFEKVARMLVEMGFDGIDINMGCPVKKVINQSSCSDLIRHPQLAQEIIAATKKGAGDIPVSVKTRIGFAKIDIENWIPKLLEAAPAALTVHLRTVREMSKVAAHWELMPQIMEIVRSHPRTQIPGSRPVVLGNGDVQTLSEAREKVDQTGCDGVMLGRAIFGNPWLFSGLSAPSISERMRAMLEHTRSFEQEFNPPADRIKNFEVMKKHYKAYVNGFDGAKELRMKLMTARDYAGVEKIILEHYPALAQAA